MEIQKILGKLVSVTKKGFDEPLIEGELIQAEQGKHLLVVASKKDIRTGLVQSIDCINNTWHLNTEENTYIVAIL